jgi:hypothetical protein
VCVEFCTYLSSALESAMPEISESNEKGGRFSLKSASSPNLSFIV